MIAFAYTVALSVTCIYAVLCGGREGRAIVGIIATLFAISFILKNALSAPSHILIASLLIDCLSLSLKIWLALYSRKSWPINVAALQLVSVCTQVAILLSPAFEMAFHDLVSTVWAIPTLSVIALGIFLDRRYDRKAAFKDAKNGNLEAAASAKA